jgi:HEXXH motif-containing protein
MNTHLDIEPLLGTWQVVPDAVLALRAVHARALNAAVARRLAVLDGGPSELDDRVGDTTWTTPELAFAHYVALQRPEPSHAQLRATRAALADVCDHDAPPPALVVDGTAAWHRYGIEVLMADYLRDGRPVEIDLSGRPAPDDVRAARAALDRLAHDWPEMAQTIDALVRQVVWYETAAGPSSGTLHQTYGALFVARGRGVARALEALVHETTHLELIARFAVDKPLANMTAAEISPFREQPRPLSRVLHAVVVARRVVEAFDRCAAGLPPSEQRQAATIRQTMVESLEVGNAALGRTGDWTPTGARLYESLMAA